MSRAKRRGAGRRKWPWVLLALVLVVGCAAGVGAWRFGLLDRWLDPTDPADDPAAVAPPEGLDLPEITDPVPVLDAIETSETPVDTAAVEAAISGLLADEDLGPEVMVAVAPLTSDDPDSTNGAYVSGVERATPASTTKVLTSVAALEALGPDATFSTDVVDAGDAGEVDGGAATGVRRLVLVGGGDPLLEREPVTDDASLYPRDRASLRELAQETVAALAEDGTASVQVAYDATLFTGPGMNPVWPDNYGPDEVVAPISSLWVDRGRDADGDIVDDPALDAATYFAQVLGEEGAAQGITIVGDPVTGVRGSSATIASVSSAAVSEIVERLLNVSDNETAEVLAHQVGLAVEGEGSFEGGAAGVRSVLADLGIDLGDDVLTDGSGLSRENLLSAGTLLGALEVAADPDRPELRAVASGMPVAGATGSLRDRFDDADPAGLGIVRAKTGTLTGVQGLAGYVMDANGAEFRFVVIADAISEEDSLDARQTVDRIAAAIAACACSAA